VNEAVGILDQEREINRPLLIRYTNPLGVYNKQLFWKFLWPSFLNRRSTVEFPGNGNNLLYSKLANTILTIDFVFF